LQLIKFDVSRFNSSIFPEFVGGETEDDFHEANPILYDTHIPTSGFQKALLAVGSAVVGLADPWRADMVAVNGEVLG
jgi:Coenzyme Q (ubiquinone) biosynthesis protein Coq4